MPMTLTLALVESALQLVPEEAQSHPQIKRYAARRQKEAGEVLLDRAYHHAAMRSLAARKYPIPTERMGRPDIVHNALLQVLETPLNWEGQLRVFVHTQDQQIITINPKTRLPKNYLRFVGLTEQLFAERKVPSEDDALLSIKKGGVRDLIEMAKPKRVVGFSRLGRPALLREVANRVSKFEAPMALIGGFPRGHFTDETSRLINDLYRIDRASLDAWVVAGRFIYDYEWSIGLAQNRVLEI